MNQSPQVISLSDGRRYRRTGTCDGCRRPDVPTAQCCRFVELPLARALTEDETRWAELHAGVSVSGQVVRFDVDCSALTEAGDCSLYGLDTRPKLCSEYPQQPEQLAAGCAYHLERIS